MELKITNLPTDILQILAIHNKKTIFKTLVYPNMTANCQLFSFAGIQSVFSPTYLHLQTFSDKQRKDFLISFFTDCCVQVGKPLFLIDVANTYNKHVKELFKNSNIEIISECEFLSPTGSIRNIIILQSMSFHELPDDDE